MTKVGTCDCDPGFHFKMCTEAASLSLFLLDPSEDLEKELKCLDLTTMKITGKKLYEYERSQ